LIDKRIYFLPQNSNQEENFIYLSDSLIKNKLVDFNKIYFLHIINGFGYKSQFKNKYSTINLNWESQKSIYLMNYTERFFNILKNLKITKKCKDIRNHILIIGNDGAIQRLIINKVKPSKSFIVTDTLISNSIFRGKLIKWLFQFSNYFSLSHLVPGVSYLTAVDAIFVAEPYYKNIIKTYYKNLLVYNVNMPIHLNNRKKYYELKKIQNDKNINIIYITSAYKWHRLFEDHLCQQQDIRDLIRNYGADKEIFLRFRIHPREDKLDYDWLKDLKIDNIDISTENTLVDDLSWCNKLVTTISSVGVEARRLGIPTYIYIKNFGRNYIKNSIFENGFNIIDDINSLTNNSDYKLENNINKLQNTLDKKLYDLIIS
jgi:hypothetical protein